MTDNLTAHVGFCLARLMRHNKTLKIGVWVALGTASSDSAEAIRESLLSSKAKTQKVEFSFEQMAKVVGLTVVQKDVIKVKEIFNASFTDTGLVFLVIRKLFSSSQEAKEIYAHRNLIAHGAAISSKFPSREDVERFSKMHQSMYAQLITYFRQPIGLTKETRHEVAAILEEGRQASAAIFALFNEANILKKNLKQSRPSMKPRPEDVKEKLCNLVDRFQDNPEILRYLYCHVPARITPGSLSDQ